MLRALMKNHSGALSPRPASVRKIVLARPYSCRSHITVYRRTPKCLIVFIEWYPGYYMYSCMALLHYTL